MPPFVPKPRKQRARREAASAATSAAAITDPNAAVILPGNKADREEQKRRLREELRREQATKPSAKKQKRLDKYIENKLRRDETMEVLKLLEGEKVKDDERKAKEGGGVKRMAEVVGDPRKNKRRRMDVEVSRGEGESEDEFESEHPEMFEEAVKRDDVAMGFAGTAPVGSGLAKPLEIGPDGLPVIATRPGRKRRRAVPEMTQETDETSQEDESVEDEWAGFSDDDKNLDNADDERARKMKIIEQILAQEEEEESYDSDDISEADDGVSLSGDEDGSMESRSEDEEEGDTDPTSETDSEHDSDASEASEEDRRIKPRDSAFKAWATQQLNQSLGHTPSYEAGNLPTQLPSNQQPAMPRPPTINPILKSMPVPTEPNRKAYSVHVERQPEMESSRSELPILQREQEIMEAIHNNSVVIIKGDTGSGKTTQVPQFLYEAGYGSPDGPTPGMIGITQPRRVAAVSMAKRVGDELGSHKSKVAYQIRFDSNVSSQTAVKFMTDGILLRELSQDLLLRKYSVLVIDEAHERSVNTDILIGILSKVVPARMRKTKFNPDPKPLKLVIMSATLNISDFLNDQLFETGMKPPIVEAEGRQHRVTTHFALRSRADYLDEVVEKVRRAHRKLPRGGMLVFLTGQNEIREVGDRLQKLLGRPEAKNVQQQSSKVQLAASEVPFEVEDMEIETIKQAPQHDDFDDVEFVTGSDDEAEEDEFDISDEDQTPRHPSVAPPIQNTSKEAYESVHILPLYSQLPTTQQLRVFDPPPVNARLIVLATNVAETSLTIPGIRYVFDTGRSKERKYNLATGVQSFEIDWISKASAAQRAGRAGRTGPGHCWRLYTSAVYEQFFTEHAAPEILKVPAEGVVLQLKGFGYPKPVVDFPFPSRPEDAALVRAEKLLRNLGALNKDDGKITDLGKELAVYPLSPRLGKILTRGVKDESLLGLVVALVAGLAVQEVFVSEAQLNLVARDKSDGEVYSRVQQEEDEARDARKQALGRAKATLSKHDKLSDVLKLLTAIVMYNVADDKEAFCREYFVRPKAMFEVSQLQRQLISIVKVNNPSLQAITTPRISSKQSRSLNALAAAGYIDQVAIRADLAPIPPEMPNKPRRAIDVPYLPLMPLSDRPSAALLEKAVFIHPSSVIARQPHKDLPQYMVYSHLQKSQAHDVGNEVVPKTRMFPLTPIDGRTLVELSKDTALLDFGKPVLKMKIEELPGVPKRRECWVTTELRSGKGSGYGWPLPAVRVRQVMDVKAANGWRVEEMLNS